MEQASRYVTKNVEGGKQITEVSHDGFYVNERGDEREVGIAYSQSEDSESVTYQIRENGEKQILTLFLYEDKYKIEATKSINGTSAIIKATGTFYDDKPEDVSVAIQRGTIIK
jgi:hypothetical protein